MIARDTNAPIVLTKLATRIAPVRAVIDEPVQHRLVVGDETAAIEDVLGDQHEEREVRGRPARRQRPTLDGKVQPRH